MGKKWKVVKQDMDLLIEIAYKAKYNTMECPPKEEVWSNIKNSLNKKQKSFIKRKSLTAAILFLIFTGLFFVSNPTSVGAFANKIIESIINITEDTFNIRRKVNVKNTSNTINTEFDDPRLTDTQNLINFDLRVPQYMPKDYYLEKINVLNSNNEQEIVFLHYTNINSKEDTQKSFIQIEQESNPNGINISLNLLREKDTKIKKAKIHGNEYILVFYKNGFSKLMWDIGNISYTIQGKISEDEMLKIAESMR